MNNNFNFRDVYISKNIISIFNVIVLNLPKICDFPGMFGLLKVKTKRFHQNATKALTPLSNEQRTTTVYHPLTIIKIYSMFVTEADR